MHFLLPMASLRYCVGVFAAFKRHGASLGYDDANVRILSQDSTTVSPQQIRDMGFPAFRYFSVDGGHSFDVTMRDLELASCMLHDQGVVVVS
jgi:hypothetical protein